MNSVVTSLYVANMKNVKLPIKRKKIAKRLCPFIRECGCFSCCIIEGLKIQNGGRIPEVAKSLRISAHAQR